MNKDNVLPLLGFSFVRMEGALQNAGPIIIPKKFRGKPSGVGKVIAASMTEEQARDWPTTPVGRRVVFTRHAAVKVFDGDSIVRVPNSELVGIIEDDAAVVVKDLDAPERCSHCGAAKSGTSNTMLLDARGFCPRCHRNAVGDLKDDTPKVSDAEVEQFREIQRRQLAATS
jgi:hypothetical protein